MIFFSCTLVFISMPFIFLAALIVIASVFVFIMAAHEQSIEMVFGGIAILLAAGALITLFLVFRPA